MTIRTRIISIVALLTLFAGITFAGVQSKDHTGKVLEALKGGGYTYLKVEENKNEFWIAGPQILVKVGTTVSFSEQMWMKDFKSKALDRTFERIMFVGNIKIAGSGASHGGAVLPTANFKEVSRASAKDAGTFTVAELYAKKAELDGKLVTVKGKVVKVSPNIMGKTWVHIQDGTGKEGTDKIIFTSKNQTALVGTDVTAQGVVNLDVNLGSGYFYSILVEESTFSD